jgi:hypothetical protein
MFATLIRRWLSLVSSGNIIQVFAKPYIFLITSTIRTSEHPLSYARTRSVFSAEERLEQTLRSIESVRTKVPDTLIVLLENSELSAIETATLRKVADWFISFAEDPRAVELRDGPFKGASELYMLLWIQDILRHFDYEKMFKLSGRYWLTDRFCLQDFLSDKFEFLMRAGVYSTRLYCVPKSLEAMYRKQLEKTFVAAQRGATIEAVIMQGVPQDRIHLLERLGVCGYIAPTGELIDE